MWRRIDVNSVSGYTRINGVQTTMVVTTRQSAKPTLVDGRPTMRNEVTVLLDGWPVYDVSLYVDGVHIVTVPPNED